MGRLERHLDLTKVGQVLKAGLKPHKCGHRPKTYPQIVREPSNRWPTPAYVRRRALKKVPQQAVKVG